MSTVLQIVLIFMIPAGLAYTFGYMVRDRRQGWAIFAAMSVMFFIGVFVAYGYEQRGNPILERLGVQSGATATQAGGNMEGKEVRFGIAQSALFATVTTDASCGAVNSMHDSYTPLGGLVPLFNIQTGEVIFGGTGAGLYGILLYAMLAVFIAGLMVGRTPEYVGKRIEQKEVKMAMLALIATAFSILVFTSISSVVPFPKGGYWNSFGPATAQPQQRRPARVRRDSVRLHERYRQQRQRICRHQREHALVQPDDRPCDDHRPLPVPAAASGRGGQPRDEEGRARDERHAADPRRSVRRPPRRHGHHRRRADVLPGPRARPDCRTFSDAPGTSVLPGDPPCHGDAMAVAQMTPAPPRPEAAKSEDLTSLLPTKLARARPLFDPEIVGRAFRESFVKLNPATLLKNPVMFVVEVGAVLTTVFVARDVVSGRGGLAFGLQIALWLWFTVLFANFAEAMAEARGKAQADTLRKTKTDVLGKRFLPNGKTEQVPASALRAGDVVICEVQDVIPGDGDVIEGVASVDESVITGESAPVIRESGGDRSAVTGGTRVLSDWIKVKITSNPGETFLDRMIALVEGAQRQKTPNEIALNILIAGLTLIFLLAVATLGPYAAYSVSAVGAGTVPSVAVLVSLLVCLIPTTIGGLLSAIGIAGMDRVMQHNVLAMSGKAVEASGDVHTLLLDKTGTITLGNRQAVEFLPFHDVEENELADVAQLASLADETPEGRSIVVLAKERFNLRGREVRRSVRAIHSVFGLYAHERRRSQRPGAAEGRVGCDRRLREGARRHRAADVLCGDGQDLAHGRHAAGRRGRRPAARPRAPERCRQGRHEGSHRPAPGHGHPVGHDHRRQSR